MNPPLKRRRVPQETDYRNVRFFNHVIAIAGRFLSLLFADTKSSELASWFQEDLVLLKEHLRSLAWRILTHNS